MALSVQDGAHEITGKAFSAATAGVSFAIDISRGIHLRTTGPGVLEQKPDNT